MKFTKLVKAKQLTVDVKEEFDKTILEADKFYNSVNNLQSIIADVISEEKYSAHYSDNLISEKINELKSYLNSINKTLNDISKNYYK